MPVFEGDNPLAGTIAGMPNIAAVLKAEVSRLVRKELRVETEGLKKALASSRSEISALKKRMQSLEKQSAQASRAARKTVRAVAAPAAEEGTSLRFRAAGMASNRKRLGLSAADFGRLVGATGQSIYAWESGKTKPKATNLAAIASLRGVSKQEAVARLEALR